LVGGFQTIRLLTSISIKARWRSPAGLIVFAVMGRWVPLVMMGRWVYQPNSFANPSHM